ncbi:MAG: VanZ family protein [Chromatiaceae bacterium]|nr:VanZ family protein [Chromatiaceae bacterium]
MEGRLLSKRHRLSRGRPRARVVLFAFDESRARSAFRLALLISVLAISYLAFAPLEQAPGTSSDKLNHFLAFFVLAWLADRSYPGRHLASFRWTFLFGYAFLIELVQAFLPFRESSLLDFVADAVGILGYSLLSGPSDEP